MKLGGARLLFGLVACGLQPPLTPQLTNSSPALRASKAIPINCWALSSAHNWWICWIAALACRGAFGSLGWAPFSLHSIAAFASFFWFHYHFIKTIPQFAHIPFQLHSTLILHPSLSWLPLACLLSSSLLCGAVRQLPPLTHKARREPSQRKPNSNCGCSALH